MPVVLRRSGPPHVLLFGALATASTIASEFAFHAWITNPVWLERAELFDSLAFVALSTGMLYFLFREHNARRDLEVRAEADRMLRLFYELPFVGMAVTSADSHRFVRFNDALCTILGYSRDELRDKTWADLTPAEDRDREAPDAERLRQGEIDSYAMDKRFIRRDGSLVYCHLEVRCSRLANGTIDYLVSTVNDLSERRAADEKIAGLTKLYATLSRCNEAIVRCASEEDLFRQVCQATVEEGGLEMAWVGITDEQGRVVPVASAGAHTDYLDGLIVVVDGDNPFGRGPAGTSIRKNQPCWCSDFRTATRTAPWRERAAPAGWVSCASLPLRRHGIAIGCFTVYSVVADRFDARTQLLLGMMANNISFALDSFSQEAQQRQAEALLLDQFDELRRWNAAMLGREGRILELKHEVNELAARLGLPPRYASAAVDEVRPPTRQSA